MLQFAVLRASGSFIGQTLPSNVTSRCYRLFTAHYALDQLCKNNQEEMERTFLTMIAAVCQSISTPDSITQTKRFGRGLARDDKINPYSMLIGYFNSSLCESVMYHA